MGKLSKNTIQMLFNKYDKNKNGVIEKAELTECFKEIIGSIEEMSPEELEKIVNEGMKNFDENANGVIELNEFSNIIKFFVEEKGITFEE